MIHLDLVLWSTSWALTLHFLEDKFMQYHILLCHLRSPVVPQLQINMKLNVAYNIESSCPINLILGIYHLHQQMPSQKTTMITPVLLLFE
jgi:hypothetical protein